MYEKQQNIYHNSSGVHDAEGKILRTELQTTQVAIPTQEPLKNLKQSLHQRAH